MTSSPHRKISHSGGSALRRRCRRMVLPLLAALTALSACRPDTPLNAFTTIAEDGWSRDDTLRFPIDTLRTAGRYAVVLSLRAAAVPEAYPYTELIVAVTLSDSTANAPAAHTDTLQMALTSPRGDMEGSGTALSQFDLPIDTLTLPAGYRGAFAITHLMRRDPIPGIRNVGLSLRRLE